jgi:hypothetical protein
MSNTNLKGEKKMEKQLTKEFYEVQKKNVSDEVLQQELRQIMMKLTEVTGKTYFYGPTSKKEYRYALTALAASVENDLESVEL